MSFPLYRLCCRGLSRCYLDILKTLLWQSLAHSCITLRAPGAHHLNAPDCAAVTAPHWCPSVGSPAITFRPELPSRRPLSAGHIPATGCSSPGPRGYWMKEWERRGRERETNTWLCHGMTQKEKRLARRHRQTSSLSEEVKLRERWVENMTKRKQKYLQLQDFHICKLPYIWWGPAIPFIWTGVLFDNINFGKY